MNHLTYAIDFGTSNSLLAAAGIDSQSRIAKAIAPITLDPKASHTDPSILRSIMFVSDSDQWFFGREAIDEYTAHGANGRLFRSIKKYLPDSSFEGTRVHGRQLSLVDLIARFLRTLRERANEYFQADVKRVVLGRPALFSENLTADALAEKRMDAAARLAGFTEISFLAEPIAAALDYQRDIREDKILLVADFGGGTSDFTVVRLRPQGFSREDVLAIGGLSIAGDMFDGSIMKHMLAPHFGTEVTYRLPTGSNDLSLPRHLVNKLCSPADINFLGRSDIMRLLKDAQRWSLSEEDAQRMQRMFTLVDEHLGYALFREIERCKISLSDAEAVACVFKDAGIDLQEQLVRGDFRVHAHDLVEKIMANLDETLQRAGLKSEAIDHVVATGGTAKLPALRWELERRFGAAKLSGERFFHSVVSGLAEYARYQIL